ncbi:MAG: PRC-barrel domain-containing protein [Candidatus Acidiferrales bacterium]
MAANRKMTWASALMEGVVLDERGKKLGEIADVMLDLQSGKIAYALLSFGGLFGFGSALYAVSPQTLCFDEENECFRLNGGKAELEAAPEFDTYAWPDLAGAAQQQNRIYLLRGKRHGAGKRRGREIYTPRI